MSRVVRVEDVQAPAWSTRALAWGYDVETGHHVAFALSKERAANLQLELQSEGEAFYKPHDLDVLFARHVPQPADL